MLMSFLTSPSSIFDTGMPVHFETIRAMSSSSTSSFSIRARGGTGAPPVRPASAPSVILFSSCSACRSRPYRISATRCRFPLRSSVCSSVFSCSIFSLSCCARAITSFSCFQRALSAFDCSRIPASSFSTAASRSRELASSSFFSACFSISSCVARRSSWSISVGMESIWMRSEAAASSIRSIALSGRKRSEM